MKCFHCGDECPKGSTVTFEAINFCCYGCKTVYEIIKNSDLNGYYKLEQNPGIKAESFRKEKYAILDQKEISSKWVLFEDDKIIKTVFSVPQIHCSSCIWLLENLTRLHKGFIHSNVEFANRKVNITFSKKAISLRQVAEILSSIGYHPNLDEVKENRSIDRSMFYKIGVAGFCFGNIMLLSFPHYLDIDKSFESFKGFFSLVSFFLSLPVFFYAGWGYVQNAYKGLQQRFVNMDIPIALGMITLFLRSSYEVLSLTGSGYFDSLSGLVFFLLLGKWFQQKTYKSLSFERDYRSYFPVAVFKTDGSLIMLEDLSIGDCVVLRNNELIPADSVLLSKESQIDYSFVTGESILITKNKGDQIYAGGRHVGKKIKVKIKKNVNNSHLTQLWNQEIFKNKTIKNNLYTLSNKVSKYFTAVVLFITLITAIYWWQVQPSTMWNAITAVLIVACPCALALSVPFALGNTMRILGKRGLYLKNAETIEEFSRITTVIFDKTGTLTYSGTKTISYMGPPLSDIEKSGIKSLSGSSFHPLSFAVKEFLKASPECSISNFKEIEGKGIEGSVMELNIKLGSATFLGINEEEENNISKVHVSINQTYRGCFQIEQHYRSGLSEVISKVKKQYWTHIISGDNDGQIGYLRDHLGVENLKFNQSPLDKLDYIRALQGQGERVLMFGDGLNDSGALKQGNVGVSISDNIHLFSPSCDAILDANNFSKIPSFLSISKVSIRIVKFSFLISFMYNIVGIMFAVSGQLSPIIAAVLMPLSSLTVVLFCIIATNFFSSRY